MQCDPAGERFGIKCYIEQKGEYGEWERGGGTNKIIVRKQTQKAVMNVVPQMVEGLPCNMYACEGRIA